ncbi:MAG TPA: hypothetical protein PLT91_04470 [Clostridia bacterium]|jgi:hypothetical protein|nr:MAG: hypothetical protein BWX97_02229 [Firmicutes bacterium ADurb.Bin146]HOD92609.1 hypothetical protein [Clostridia bacterium]HQM39477.1 hypothetical protein [Clostridia bacterium]
MKRKILTDYNAPYIKEILYLVQTQSKLTLAHWAIDYAEAVMLKIWQKYYPDDRRPYESIVAAKRWLAGVVKLPYVKTRILECHACARETKDNLIAFTAARAIGQCASTIHSARHCMGLVMYGALSIAYEKLGTDAPWEHIEEAVKEECLKMKEALINIAV